MIFKNNKTLFIFLIFLFLYLFCGFYLSYFNNIIYQIRHDLIYNMDSGFIFRQFSEFSQKRYVSAHIFSPLIYTSTFFFFKSIIKTSIPSFIIMQSTFGALSVCILNFILNYLNIDKKITIFLTFCFGLSYSNLIFTGLPECYILSGFINMLLACYSIYLLKSKNDLSFLNIIILVILSNLALGINIINIICSLLIILYVFIYKLPEKTNSISRTEVWKKFFQIIFIFVFIFTFVALVQRSVFKNDKSPFAVVKQIILERQEYPVFENYYSPYIEINDIKYALRGTFINPIYSIKTTAKILSTIRYMNNSDNKQYISHEVLEFQDIQNIFVYFPAIIFYAIIFVLFIKNRKKIIEKDIAILMASIIFINFLFNIFYGAKCCFLYSQNFIAYLFILIGLILNTSKHKIIHIVNIAFLLFQIYVNSKNIFVIKNFLSQYSYVEYNIDVCIFLAVIATLIYVFALFIAKKILRRIKINDIGEKYKFYLILYAIYILIFLIYCINGKNL